MRQLSQRGAYHLALLIVSVTAFNGAFETLMGVNIVRRLFDGIVIPNDVLAIIVCVAAVMVWWRNWAD